MPIPWERIKQFPPCRFKGCGRHSRYVKTGLCAGHQRQLRAGVELYALRRPNGSAWETRAGYLKVTRNGRQTSEHRYAMETYLERPLLPGETVHHKNGVRSDNRLSNLELRVGAHPKGLTVEEAVAWAEEIISRYC